MLLLLGGLLHVDFDFGAFVSLFPSPIDVQRPRCVSCRPILGLASLLLQIQYICLLLV